MKEQGVVVKADGNKVSVHIEMNEGCGVCADRDNCKVIGRNLEALINSNTDVKLGDKVELDIPTGNRGIAFVLFFVVPVAMFFAAYYIPKAFFAFQNENIPVLIGLLATLLGFFVSGLISKKIPSLNQKPSAKKLSE